MDLIQRLRKRAEIRKQIPTRKSVQNNEPDRLADLLEEAADAVEDLMGAIQMIYNHLGPNVSQCISCEGCEYEISNSLRIARNYIPLDKRVGDQEQPFLDPDFEA